MPSEIGKSMKLILSNDKIEELDKLKDEIMNKFAGMPLAHVAYVLEYLNMDSFILVSHVNKI